MHFELSYILSFTLNAFYSLTIYGKGKPKKNNRFINENKFKKHSENIIDYDIYVQYVL